MSTLDNIEHHLPIIPQDSIRAVHPNIPVAVLKRKLKEYLKDNHKKQPFRRKMTENSDHFKELTLIVHDLHERLEQEKSPYRFCIYLENGEIMIDTILLNEKGETIKTMKKDITHEDFIKWFEDLEHGTGILFDSTV